MSTSSLRTLALATAFALVAASAAPAQQFTMKMSTPTINDVAHEYLKAMKTGIEARSGGRIKVEVYPANQLGQLPATIDGVTMGTIELTFPAVGFLIGLEPRFETLDAAGLFDSIEHGTKVLQSPEIRARLATFGEAKGVEPLLTILNGPLMLVSHKPVRTVADIKGQKLRSPGAARMHTEPFRKLGASPIAMPVGDMLPAMQNHAIDGVITAISIVNGFKYYDFAKAATYLPGSFAVASGLVNRRFMKSLGPELEAIVREESKKAETLFLTFGVQDAEKARQNWVKNGGEAIVLSPEETKSYLEQVTSVIPGVVNSNPKMKEDYEALLAAAKKYR